ncbi:hypothetical protein HYPSUDRAFT_59560 [Hypholoma sublateritium FD-334 SS-4]|uniref:Anaphase-promoting complex subunit 4 WD40 domain-containing protein n=1 Tax=Hypholoma sublateritium (strain FD-334 SS-4) TaxID=945553 RepID=A0A0D2LTF2_HYPSF|nr:hypothetical protein HYPSUDRAFT_59560 [Hypholoma sublateritium FD-334 SS-4]
MPMEGTHPPEMPRRPPIYESLGPTSDQSLVSLVEFSSAAELLAIGYEDGLVEIFELVDKDWVCLYVFHRADATPQGAEAVQESPVCLVRWHPILAHEMIVGFGDGSAHIVSFLDQSGDNWGKATSLKVIDFSPSCISSTINWKHATLNKTASKLIGLVGRDVFVYKKPFNLDDVYDLTVFRALPKRAVQHDPLNVWYLDHGRTLLVLHPLAISWVSTRRKTLTYSLPFPDTRTLSSAAISPSKEFLVAINIRGDAELFSVIHKQLLQVLREDVGPFRPLVSAIFYGRSSLALAYADRPDLQIIPDLNICGYQQAREIQLLRHNKCPYPPGSSLKLYVGDSTMICGQGHIILAKPDRKPGSNLSIVIPSNAQFHVVEPPSPPGDEVRRYSEVVLETLTELVETPTELVETPTVLVETPTVLVETRTAASPRMYWKIPGFSVGFARW